MTIATSMKSPGQKPRTPRRGAPSPNAKSPKGTPNVKTPKGKMPKKAGTPARTPQPMKQANGTPKPKTPKGGATPVAQPQKSTPKPQTPKSVQKTPAAAQKTPKGTPQVKPQTPKQGKAGQTPNKQKSPQKRSASVAGLDASSDPKLGLKTVRIYNLPEMASTELTKKVKELLEPRGEIDSIKFHDGNKGRNVACVAVVFSKPEEARAAKKLNGVLLGGRHLTIVHSDDRDLPTDNRIVISNVPTDLDDEDVWSLYGSCGKILCIHMNRDWRTKKVQRCFVTFDTKKGADSALSTPKECRGKQLVAKKAGKDGRMFPIESTIYILNLSTDASEKDVQQFVSKSAPVSGVVVVESKRRYAMVHLTNEADVEKALALTGKVFNGKEVKVERHRKSSHYVQPNKKETAKNTTVKQEVPAKKLKGKNGAAVAVKEEDEDDDDEEMSDDSESDLLAAFQGKMRKLKSGQVKTEEDDDDDDDDDEEDDEDDEDDDEAEGDSDGEEEDDDEDDDDEDDDDDDDDDE